MSWQKLSDDLWEHLDVALLGEQMLPAMGLWTLALSWSGAKGTEGFVPFGQLARLAGHDVSDLSAALIRVGLWEAVDGGIGFHKWVSYNLTNEQQAERVAQRQAAAKKRARGARRGERGQFLTSAASDRASDRASDSLDTPLAQEPATGPATEPATEPPRTPSPVLPSPRGPVDPSPGQATAAPTDSPAGGSSSPPVVDATQDDAEKAEIADEDRLQRRQEVKDRAAAHDGQGPDPRATR